MLKIDSITSHLPVILAQSRGERPIGCEGVASTAKRPIEEIGLRCRDAKLDRSSIPYDPRGTILRGWQE